MWFMQSYNSLVNVLVIRRKDVQTLDIWPIARLYLVLEKLSNISNLVERQLDTWYTMTQA